MTYLIVYDSLWFENLSARYFRKLNFVLKKEEHGNVTAL